MARIRTAKSLGSRHDRNYFRQWTTGRKWRVGLSVAIPVLTTAWLIGHAIAGDSVPYSSGPLSPSHAVFGKNCEACHESKTNLFGRASFQRHVTDNACLGCHDAPGHQANALFNPGCSSCHVEHKGADLVHGSDGDCATCHGNLKTRDGVLKYASQVSSFTSAHPEFSAVRRSQDPGAIKLNHEVHLRPDLKGPNGTTVQLHCENCHRAVADSNGPWKFADAEARSSIGQVSSPSAELVDLRESVNPAQGRSYMAPIKFANHCAACHDLHFDPRIDEAVPHGKKTEELHALLQATYRRYLAAHPGAWREASPRLWLIPGQQELRVAKSPDDWLQIQTAQAETLLWRKTCKLCHTLEFGSAASLPEIKRANLPARWLPHSTFSHYAHQAIACDSCHSTARHSKETSDVLIPGIATCRKCHNASTSQIGQDRSGCYLCHQYHDWKARKPGLKGTFTIEQLLAKKAR